MLTSNLNYMHSPVIGKLNFNTTIKKLLIFCCKGMLEGIIKWDKNIFNTIEVAMCRIDRILSRQLSVIIHTEFFKKLEGSWRALHKLVFNVDNNAIKIKILSTSKQKLYEDLSKSSSFMLSEIYKKIYEHEFGLPGGEPYGVLIGDYEFENSPHDIELLQAISNISSRAFCPFITSPSPKFFGIKDWSYVHRIKNLSAIFDSIEYTKWNNLRESENARFISMVMPRVLARFPYANKRKKTNEFNLLEESNFFIQKIKNQYTDDLDKNSKLLNNKYVTDSLDELFIEKDTEIERDVFEQEALKLEDLCWSNAAYYMCMKMATSFTKYGWCTAIRGYEGGGKIDDLPLYIFTGKDSFMEYFCPTETPITDYIELDLSKLGFLPICHYKNSDIAVFFSGQTIQKPKKYSDSFANANAVISAGLPYIMAISRFSHYIKIMARDKIGSFTTKDELNGWLNNWIIQYVNGSADASQALKAKYPLIDAKIHVEDVDGLPGSYQAVVYLKPWLQLEEISISTRLVVNIPKNINYN